jgi:predicted Zn-dependent protease
LRDSRRARWLAVWVTALLIGATPTPADADIFTPSVNDQIKLGDQAAVQVLQKYRVVRDERSQRVEAVGQRLLASLSTKERGPWEYRFYTIDSKEVNAFALPGGKIFMFTGLYDRIQTEDELAGVMAHELAHVYKQHWARAAGEQAKRQAGIAVLLGLSGASRTWQNVAGVANSLLSLRYSRKDEDQSDSEGLKNMVAAGYNPKGLLGLFQVLEKAGGGGGGPSFLASHPLTKDRIQRTQQRIDRLPSRDFPAERPLR